ncbi:MAG: hypothetical protein KIT84_40290 [Labilithrix sp.]|nr:hypothetical protein [Labilithrix sp.]MCW5817307.1 hypothetical protein [Labilithrix sp.]
MSSSELPIRGTITSWQPDDSIGRIKLASGEEVRFGHSACVNIRPAVGAEVWVVELAPHPLGGRRAKVVSSTGAVTSDRATDARKAEEQRAQLRAAIEAEIKKMRRERDVDLAALRRPWEVAEDIGMGIEAIKALRDRMPRDEVAAFASTIAAVDDSARISTRKTASQPDLRLFELEWADAWTHLALWTDPVFVPFAEEPAAGDQRGNHLGLFAHPAALATGIAAPVVFRFQEHDPVFAWVAESADHFVRMIDAASRGDDVESLRGKKHDVVISLMDQVQKEEAFEDVERKDVHALFWSGARKRETEAAKRLEARYRDRAWSFPLASIEAQQILATWQDKIDAAWSKLK